MPSRYAEVYGQWKADPQGFWREAAQSIDWIKPPQVIFDPKAGVWGHWFPDATCNTCWNAVDRHALGARANQNAIIYDSPVTNTKRAITYAQLLEEVSTLGAAMTDLGIVKGDRVIIYMPMIPEAAVAMLACARIGAIHSVVFGGFAAKELATRIDDSKPKLILAASCGIEPGRIVTYKPLLDAAIEMSASKPAHVVLFQRPQSLATMIAGRDHDWVELLGRTRAGGRTRRSALNWPRPIRSMCSTPQARPACPKAWCATMAATWSRFSGRCKIFTASIRVKRSGRHPMLAGWWAIPTLSMARCCTVAPAFSMKASLSALPIPAHSGA